MLVQLILARSRRLKNDIGYARRLLAPRKAKEGIRRCRQCLADEKPKEFYDAVFDTLQEYLGGTFHLPSKGITMSVIDEVLQPRSVPTEILQKLRDIFSHCDMARFAVTHLAKSDMELTLQRLEEVIDYLQRHKSKQ